VHEEIVRLKAENAAAGCRTLAHLFNRHFAARGMTVGKTFVHDLIRRQQYEIEILRRRLKHRRPKPVPLSLIWALDLTGKVDRGREVHQVLGILEHQSRAVLSLQALAQKSTIAVLRCLLDAIERFGTPKIVRTDNEAIFTSRVFRFALSFLGIRHQRTEPGHPWQNGRIERLFGTLKRALDPWEVESRAQLATALSIFRFWYNHVRPHDYLDGRTPAEVWRGVDPFARVPVARTRFHAWDGLLTGVWLKY
jgi:transposase InsO family protein